MARTTIRSEDITGLQVKTGDIAADAVTAAKIASGAVDTTGLEDDIALLGFKVAANGSLAKYDLVDQTIDDFQDASGIDASASTNEMRDASGKYYSGIIVTDDSPTGGTTSTYGSTKVNTFLSDDDFVVTSSGNVDMLIVGGGGGGGGISGSYHQPGAGAGAGGMRAITGIAVTAQTYAIDVGAGGTGSVDGGGATSGSNSTGLGYTASGGGKGGSWNDSGTGGGSGGGGSGAGTYASGNSGGYTPSEGNRGGNGGTSPGASHSGGGGGGGGAGAVGAHYVDTGVSYPPGGDGGDGLENNYRTGSNVFYAGGGGGGGFYTTGGSGGQGGGGPGYGSGTGGAGTANTGGGGGGANGQPSGDGGDGGSGIVVIKYPDDEFQSSAAANLTLVSNSTTAEATPTKGDIVLTYTNGAGSTTLGTDLTAEFSADDGSTWTAMTLASEGATGSHNIATAHDVSLTSTSGTSMRYRIKTLNQSVSKTTRIQAVSLGWS